ncbi:MAG: hypothetical protein H7195_08575 [Chryseobacterium sp.]|nr:hypothetical protein [Chryseobacterium sp.]
MQRKIEDFIKKGLPEEWFDYSTELKGAAEILWKSNGNTLIGYYTEKETYTRKLFSRVYFFLLGIAIENLIKGILISEYPQYLKDGKISSEISSGHNIKNLSGKITSLSFDKNENEIFEILSELIPYWGKYPIPKNFNHVKNEKFFDEVWYENLIRLYEKLELQLYKLNINGIPGPNGVHFPKLYISYLHNKL